MLPAELRGTQVLSGCINADVKEDKNKRDYCPPNQVVRNVEIPVSVQTNSNNDSSTRRNTFWT